MDTPRAKEKKTVAESGPSERKVQSLLNFDTKTQANSLMPGSTSRLFSDSLKSQSSTTFQSHLERLVKSKQDFAQRKVMFNKKLKSIERLSLADDDGPLANQLSEFNCSLNLFIDGVIKLLSDSERTLMEQHERESQIKHHSVLLMLSLENKCNVLQQDRKLSHPICREKITTNEKNRKSDKKFDGDVEKEKLFKLVDHKEKIIQILKTKLFQSSNRADLRLLKSFNQTREAFSFIEALNEINEKLQTSQDPLQQTIPNLIKLNIESPKEIQTPINSNSYRLNFSLPSQQSVGNPSITQTNDRLRKAALASNRSVKDSAQNISKMLVEKIFILNHNGNKINQIETIIKRLENELMVTKTLPAQKVKELSQLISEKEHELLKSQENLSRLQATNQSLQQEIDSAKQQLKNIQTTKMRQLQRVRCIVREDLINLKEENKKGNINLYDISQKYQIPKNNSIKVSRLFKTFANLQSITAQLRKTLKQNETTAKISQNFFFERTKNAYIQNSENRFLNHNIVQLKPAIFDGLSTIVKELTNSSIIIEDFLQEISAQKFSTLGKTPGSTISNTLGGLAMSHQPRSNKHVNYPPTPQSNKSLKAGPSMNLHFSYEDNVGLNTDNARKAFLSLKEDLFRLKEKLQSRALKVQNIVNQLSSGQVVVQPQNHILFNQFDPNVNEEQIFESEGFRQLTDSSRRNVETPVKSKAYSRSDSLVTLKERISQLESTIEQKQSIILQSEAAISKSAEDFKQSETQVLILTQTIAHLEKDYNVLREEHTKISDKLRSLPQSSQNLSEEKLRALLKKYEYIFRSMKRELTREIIKRLQSNKVSSLRFDSRSDILRLSPTPGPLEREMLQIGFSESQIPSSYGYISPDPEIPGNPNTSLLESQYSNEYPNITVNNQPINNNNQLKVLTIGPIQENESEIHDRKGIPHFKTPFTNINQSQVETEEQKGSRLREIVEKLAIRELALGSKISDSSALIEGLHVKIRYLKSLVDKFTVIMKFYQKNETQRTKFSQSVTFKTGFDNTSLDLSQSGRNIPVDFRTKQILLEKTLIERDDKISMLEHFIERLKALFMDSRNIAYGGQLTHVRFEAVFKAFVDERYLLDTELAAQKHLIENFGNILDEQKKVLEERNKQIRKLENDYLTELQRRNEHARFTTEEKKTFRAQINELSNRMTSCETIREDLTRQIDPLKKENEQLKTLLCQRDFQQSKSREGIDKNNHNVFSFARMLDISGRQANFNSFGSGDLFALTDRNLSTDNFNPFLEGSINNSLDENVAEKVKSLMEGEMLQIEKKAALHGQSNSFESVPTFGAGPNQNSRFLKEINDSELSSPEIGPSLQSKEKSDKDDEENFPFLFCKTREGFYFPSSNGQIDQFSDGEDNS